MEVTIEHISSPGSGSILLIVLAGRLDTGSAPALDARLAAELARPQRNILVDLSLVSYISSAGLRSILQLVKHTAPQKGRVGLFGAQPQIVEVIEISGFPSLLDVYPDRVAALGAR
jgi:anti-anti-sigma factor